MKQFQNLYSLYLEKFANVTITQFKKGKALYPNMFADMVQIEDEIFGYNGQDENDIRDDFIQRGFYGVGLFHNEKLIGYIYGFAMIFDDNMAEINFDQLEFYDDNIKNKLVSGGAKIARKMFTPKNTIYVSNLVVNKNFRNTIYSGKMIMTFIEGLKRKTNYQYIMMNGFPDTMKLIEKRNGRLGTVRVLAKQKNDNGVLIKL